MMRRVLITGGFGYVGGRVAQLLAARGDFDIVLGSRRAQSSPAWLPDVTVAAMDWSSPESLQAACDGVGVVLHLAAMNEIECARDPVDALGANGVGTARLLQAAKVRHVARFVYFSTAQVYGEPLAGRIDETTLPRPRNPYATSHRAGEDVVLAAHDDGRIVGIALRVSNGFGAPAHSGVNRWTLLVNDLCRQAVTDRRLTLLSAGMQRRDFVTLHDVARAVSHVLDLPKEKVGNGIFNVGGAWVRRVFEMAETIQARCSTVLGFVPEIVRPEPAVGDAVPELDYRLDKLLATGFTLTGNPIAEIDATLRVCRKAYPTA